MGIKQYTIALFFSLLITSVFAQQSVTELSKNIENLIQKGDYLDAYLALNTVDPEDKNPTILLLKENIALNYYYKTERHRQFTFRNFKAGETRESAQLNEGKTETFNIDFDKKLEDFVRLYPDNFLILKGLGDFYQALADNYGENGDMPIQEVFERINFYYAAANRTKGDETTYFGEGHAKTYLGYYMAARSPLKKAHALNPTDATINYDLGYCYWNVSVRDTALMHAFMALDSFKLADQKSDAAFVIGSVYAEQGLSKMGLRYFEKANDYKPNEQKILNQLVLLNYEVLNPKRALECTNLLFLKDPTKAETYNNLQLLYTDANRFDLLIKFYEQKITEYPNKPSTLGSLHFYTGSAYLDDAKNIEAKPHFEASKIEFLKFVPKTHAVILKIDEAIAICNNGGKKL